MNKELEGTLMLTKDITDALADIINGRKGISIFDIVASIGSASAYILAQVGMQAVKEEERQDYIDFVMDSYNTSFKDSLLTGFKLDWSEKEEKVDVKKA